MTLGPKKTLNNQLLNVCTTSETTSKVQSWDDYNIQEKPKAILLQSFLFLEGREGGQMRCIIGDLQMVIVQNQT